MKHWTVAGDRQFWVMGRTACVINLELRCPRDDVVCEEEDSALGGSDLEDIIAT